MLVLMKCDESELEAMETARRNEKFFRKVAVHADLFREGGDPTTCMQKVLEMVDYVRLTGELPIEDITE